MTGPQHCQLWELNPQTGDSLLLDGKTVLNFVGIKKYDLFRIYKLINI